MSTTLFVAYAIYAAIVATLCVVMVRSIPVIGTLWVILLLVLLAIFLQVEKFL